MLPILPGFVLFTIYGGGLHVVPRFGGYPLRSEYVATLQFWLANAGLPLLIAGWLASVAVTKEPAPWSRA